jgi:methyl-accepting chemotaxis protein
MDPTVQPGEHEESPPSSSQWPERHRGNGEHELDERLHSLRDALRALRQGDFSVRLPTNGGADDPLFAEVALAFNTVAEQNDALARELDRLARAVGLEGSLGDRASLGPASGEWAAAVGSANSLLAAMALPMTEAVRILELVAAGDLSQDMPLHVGGQPLQGAFMRLGTAVNTATQRLRMVTTGVSRVVREIGAEGKLGAKAGRPRFPASRARGRTLRTT